MDEMNRRTELQATRQKGWLDARLGTLKGVSSSQRALLRPILIKAVRDYIDEEKAVRRVKLATEFLDELDSRGISRLWDGLFPGLSPHILRAWETANKRPYLRGYGRSPFRAPAREQVARSSRVQFFLTACETLHGYEPTPEWLATWAPYIDIEYRDPHVIGWILATVLCGGGHDSEIVREVLVDSINGNHPIGRMSRHAVTAMLNSSERSDWEVIERLLLAAQRQEGLRQTILESVDEANPDAFRSMLGLILENDMGRFSSVVRAFDVWLGYRWEGGSAKQVHDGIRKLCEFFDSDEVRLRAIGTGEAEDAYLAMWATAYRDADEAMGYASTLAHDPEPGRRYAGLLIAAKVGLLPEQIDIPVQRMLSGEENDERILTVLCTLLSQFNYRRAEYPVSNELFDTVAALFDRFPIKKKPLENLIWPWDKVVRERRDVANALGSLAAGNPAKMLSYAHALDSYACANVIFDIAGIDRQSVYGRKAHKKRRTMSIAERSFVIRMMVDARQEVHSAAFLALDGSDISPYEAELLAQNLHRISATFRKCAIGRLSTLPQAKLYELCSQLLSASHVKKRAAAIELLLPLSEDISWQSKVRGLVAEHEEEIRKEPTLVALLDSILGDRGCAWSMDDYLGLAPSGSRAAPVVPSIKKIVRDTKAAEACLKSIAELFLEHSETEIERRRWDDESEGSGTFVHIGSYFPGPKRWPADTTRTAGELLQELPMREVWLEWAEQRPVGLRDKDGLELVRAWAMGQRHYEKELKFLPKPLRSDAHWSLKWAFKSLTDWLPLLVFREDAVDYVIDRVEESLVNYDPKRDVSKPDYEGDRGISRPAQEIGLAEAYLASMPVADQAKAMSVRGRLGALSMLAMDRGLPGCENGPSVELFGAAYEAGFVNEADFAVLLLNDRAKVDIGRRYGRFGPIGEVTRLKRKGVMEQHPSLADIADRVRDRLIDIELARGEQVSGATEPASEIRHAGGADAMLRLVSALGRDSFVRTSQWGEPTRAYSLSKLISVTLPAEEDTDERFAALMQKYALKQDRAVEVSMYAPQWAGHIERALGATGLEDAVWWIHAHTKSQGDWRSQDIREVWAAQINERTELEADDLEEGAVDVVWYRRIIDKIGEQAWDAYQRPAKYASSSGGHKRAQLYAGTMLGRVGADELLKRIATKRNQDAVRALGLVPLPGNIESARAETLRRYNSLQEFKRSSRKYGSQRQASEGRSVDIAMQNLARTAGYRDPQRLQWAMEAEAIADLAKGAIKISVEDTTVSLSLGEVGEPVFEVHKKGKLLKDVPAKLRKLDEIVGLRSRVTELRRQASRMRLSLEESMCRGDVITGQELSEFMKHPMLRPMVERLVFINDKESTSDLIGYPDRLGKALRHCDGNLEAVRKNDSLRLAHPSDLYARGEWHEWQRECFSSERVQPFKQIFREYYPRTNSESGNTILSRRYAGHQVNPRQALALLKKRQWLFAPEMGVRRVYHDEGVIASLTFQESFYTPAEVDGLTLEGVDFWKKDHARGPMKLQAVSERVFSETMRDLDLVVSVAHAGGVDPESSASTLEMRANLLKEMCRLLSLENVSVEGHHAVIDGTRGRYSVHLGSAMTRVLPGKNLVIVAVHSQYRGRIFLPFADEDPKTAEVMAKALLLARDQMIQDPSILDQIDSN